MKLKRLLNAAVAVAMLAGSSLFARTSEAQGSLHPSFYGSGEVDTRSSQFYLLGMYVGTGRLGWSPYFNANAYALHYKISPTLARTQTLSAISPTLGLAYAARNDGVSFGAGYVWVHNPDPGAPGAEGGSSNGMTASFGAYHNARGRRALHTQLLSNYSFGSQYLWARGRGSVPFGSSLAHPARVGLELVGQSGGKNGRESNTFQAGPTLEYAWTPNFRTTGAVGFKSVGGARFTSRESVPYLKLEFSLSP